MAHIYAKEKSPIKMRAHTRAHTKPGALDCGETKFAESSNCGCSLKSFHGNLSSFTKPTKCNLSQIWPLFRHEFTMPAAVKKLDRGSTGHSNNNANAGGPSSRRGFVRSPSPQHPARKSPLFAGVSMQRDNYVEVSTIKPVDYLEEEHHHKMHWESEYDDLIPMGTIVCTAKGSPCCTDNLHCGAESGNDDLDDVEVDNEILDKSIPNKLLVRSRFSVPKRLRSTSPRSDNLYTAVEREFKRLGIYKGKDSGAPPYPQNEEKPLSPSNNKSMGNELPEFEIKALAFSLPQPLVEEEHHKFIDDTRQCYRDFEPRDDHHEHSACIDQHSIVDHQQQHDGYQLDGYLNAYAYNRQEDKTQAFEGGRLSADNRISQNNAIESFVSLSNALCMTQFSTVIKKAETSLQKFTNYLIKAKQRMMVRESPTQAPRRHEITASMIRSMMPNVKFDSPHHFKYGLQACVSKVIFDQFDTQNYGGEGEGEESYKINRQFLFLRAYYVLEALDNCNGEQLMEINGEFQQFCHRKLEAIKRRVGWESRWPSKLLQAFLCSLKDVWVAHKLAFAFEKPASIFFAKPRSPLDLEHMNPLMESAGSKLSPNPKYMNPLMESSFTKLSPNPNPNLEKVDRNNTIYMSPLLESSFNINISPKHNPNPNPSPTFMSPNLSPNPNFMSPNLSPNFMSPNPIPNFNLSHNPIPNFNLSHNPNFSPNGFVELKQISLRWHKVVQFTVFPGFFFKDDGVVHSIVYLQPKTQCVTPLIYPNLIL